MTRVLSVLAVLFLLVAACGSDGEETAARTSPSPTATEATATPSDGAAPTPEGTSAPQDEEDATTPGDGGQEDSATPKPVQPAPEGSVNRPPTGRYTYDLSGTFKDPTMVSEDSYDEGARFYEDLGRNGDTYTGETRSSNDDDNTTSTQRISWESDRILLTFIAVSAPPFVNFECEITPAVEILPIPIQAKTYPKQEWSNSSDECSGSLELKIVSQEDVTDATGRTWKTWKIENTTTYSFSGGDLTGTMSGTAWFSPDLGNIVRSDERNEGRAGQGQFRSHQVVLLRAHP